MLSIGKVGGGQADPRYYVDTVAKGREDYYTGQGEAPGVWAGSAAGAQGLSGAVDDEAFLSLLGATAVGSRKILGYDLTFSAPKSVSVLFGVGDDRISGTVREAHDRAVEEALAYVERHACWTRRGQGGQRRIRGEGLTVATFRHRTSRAGDPQLHTHAVVANETAAEGSSTALDGQALYAHARTAGYLYQAALRARLSLGLGIEWEPAHNGVAEIRGLDQEVLRHFSTRSTEIREHMARRGERSVSAARRATLETRQAKDYRVSADQLREEWRARAAEFGLDSAALHALVERAPAPAPLSPPDVRVAARSMGTAGGVTRFASTFDRRDVLRDWAEAHRDGASVTGIERLADAWLASEHAVRLEDGVKRQHLGGARYSTPEMLALERRLVDEAARRVGAAAARVDAATVGSALDAATTLAGEQRHLVQRLTTSGDGVQVVRSAAGTGKTYALAVARDAWERDGVTVQGCALAARAAVELEQLAGIDSTTIARLERELDEGYGLPRGSVLVVDEAGMVGTRAIARLAEACSTADAKLVLVGDDHQLPEIDAGGAFRGLARRLGAVELREVRRQVEDWDREALQALRRGKVREWAEAYRDHGRLVARPTATAVRNDLVDDWWQATSHEQGDAVMVAHRRIDVAELNARARDRMHADGRLSEEEISVDGRAFAVGDRVLARRNSARLDVVNGSRGEVIALDHGRQSIQVRLTNGDVRDIDSPYLQQGWLEHGYALTAHAAQGATVDRAFVLGSDELYREWGYTALTRHRIEARFYVVSPGSVERALPGLEPSPDPLMNDLIASLGPSHRKVMANDVLDSRRETVALRQFERLEELAKAADEARERGEALRRERDATNRLQRAKRAALDRQAERQVMEAARWDALAAEIVMESPARGASLAAHAVDRTADIEAFRASLLDPPDRLVAVVGARPSGLGARSTWLRAASTIVSDRTLDTLAPAPQGTMDDIGLEL